MDESFRCVTCTAPVNIAVVKYCKLSAVVGVVCHECNGRQSHKNFKIVLSTLDHHQ